MYFTFVFVVCLLPSSSLHDLPYCSQAPQLLQEESSFPSEHFKVRLILFYNQFFSDWNWNRSFLAWQLLGKSTKDSTPTIDSQENLPFGTWKILLKMFESRPKDALVKLVDCRDCGGCRDWRCCGYCGDSRDWIDCRDYID